MDELDNIRSCLNKLSQACERDRQTMAHDPGLVRELDAIRDSADAMTQEFVLRFGVIGDSNAGKSQLIGGLIGLANALPVNKIPFTGNIVVLRIKSSSQVTATELSGYRLHFISPQTATACAVQLCSVVLTELEQLQHSADYVQTGVGLRQRLSSGALSFEGMRGWLNSVWDRCADRNVNLRARLVELTRFLITWERIHPALTPSSNSTSATVAQPTAEWVHIVDVRREEAEAAMVLPATIAESSYSSLVEVIQTQVTKATGVGGVLQQLPASLNKEFASVCYPLIQEIHLNVRVPTSVWDLSRLQVDAIELYDFPGLAAQTNAGRDAFLSFRERERNRIHTWMIVINSTELKGSQASEIVRELPRDRILAVANRFDALPLWIQGDIMELERLAAPQAPPVHEREVLNRLDLLPPLTTLFELLTKPERCAVVSAMVGLVDLHREGRVQDVLNESQRRIFPEEVARGAAVQSTWLSLSQKMLQIDPRSSLARWLGDYGRANSQGGLCRLRDMLYEHANDVGLVQLAEELKERLGQLQQSVETVLVRARKQATQSSLQANELRSRLDQLMILYQDYCHPPESIEEIRLSSSLLASIQSMPNGTRPLSPLMSSPISLRDLVRDETLLRVWNWREWRTLLEAVSTNCFVDCSNITTVGDQIDEDDEDAPWKVEEALLPPTRAGQLHSQFCEAYRQIETIALSALRVSLLDFLQALAHKLSQLARDLSYLATNAPTNPVNFALRPSQTASIDYLLKSVKPVAEESPTSQFWRDRYPYLLHIGDDGALSQGAYFGWAPQRRGPGSKTEHQLYVLRLRSELTSTIESHVLRAAADGLGRFKARMNKVQAQLTDAAARLKDRTDTDLLALFGKAISNQTANVPLELETVNRTLSSIIMERT